MNKSPKNNSRNKNKSRNKDINNKNIRKKNLKDINIKKPNSKSINKNKNIKTEIPNEKYVNKTIIVSQRRLTEDIKAKRRFFNFLNRLIVFKGFKILKALLLDLIQMRLL